MITIHDDSRLKLAYSKYIPDLLLAGVFQVKYEFNGPFFRGSGLSLEHNGLSFVNIDSHLGLVRGDVTPVFLEFHCAFDEQTEILSGARELYLRNSSGGHEDEFCGKVLSCENRGGSWKPFVVILDCGGGLEAAYLSMKEFPRGSFLRGRGSINAKHLFDSRIFEENVDEEDRKRCTLTSAFYDFNPGYPGKPAYPREYGNTVSWDRSTKKKRIYTLILGANMGDRFTREHTGEVIGTAGANGYLKKFKKRIPVKELRAVESLGLKKKYYTRGWLWAVRAYLSYHGFAGRKTYASREWFKDPLTSQEKLTTYRAQGYFTDPEARKECFEWFERKGYRGKLAGDVKYLLEYEQGVDERTLPL